jgi:copper resistance protein B
MPAPLRRRPKAAAACWWNIGSRRRGVHLAVACLGLLASSLAEARDPQRTLVTFDLAEIHLDDAGTFQWESAVFVPLGAERLHVEIDGGGVQLSKLEGVDVQVLYEHPLSDTTMLWAGIERDFAAGPNLALAVIGAGIQWTPALYTETSAFLSAQGETFHQVKAIGTVPVAERLTVEPRAELNSVLHSGSNRDLDAGLTDVSASLRLRMEQDRGPAPYIGLTWSSALGDTAHRMRHQGDAVSSVAVLVGTGWSF